MSEEPKKAAPAAPPQSRLTRTALVGMIAAVCAIPLTAGGRRRRRAFAAPIEPDEDHRREAPAEAVARIQRKTFYTGCRSAGCRTLAECLCTCDRCLFECAHRSGKKS